MFALVTAVIAIGAPLPSPPTRTPKIPLAELQAWVRDLDSNQFKVRDAAEKRLRNAGVDAIPILTQTALSNTSAEVADRSIRLLGEFQLSANEALARAVRPALEKIANSESAVAGQAVSILKNLRASHLERMRAVGVRFDANSENIRRVSFAGAEAIKPLVPLLEDFPEIEELDFSTKIFGDEEMKLLPSLPNLERLNLFQSNIGDESLKEFKRFPKLRSVPMGRTRVTDAGLAHIAELTELEYVGVRGNKVTDKGVLHLKKLTNLTGVNLGETQVTDAGLAEITVLTKLEYIYLFKINVTDKGIEHLKSFKKLTYADIHGTKITSTGIDELRNALPRVRIINEGSDD